ncbi:hypothetical protein EYZ11_006990 [Aspergillus tanneri]|uniref:Rhodopsin domain-containing protein n=1 Tax=Aspergillus tanneri TaxID=1220188 RepID=A0A4S3JEE3_9EURO|nr:uncharacterized protein ATNIH1004_005741 [Aspergillus tanneri]KAA8647058.1 hypothetical protein ATNIH1004_005741 [Aspergillus tanneri]THC93530.1 hypothetical protein EYZ11_006990 [Aspergillus tanneri]
MVSKTPLEQILQLPAATPPPGVKPNLVDPPNLKAAGLAVILVFWILCTVLLIVRLYTKILVIHKVNLSDYSILLAWAIFMGYFAPAWLMLQVAPGVDQWNMRLKDFSSMLYSSGQYYYVASVLYGCIIFFIKLAILLQFVEVFVPMRQRDRFYWTCHVLIAVNFVFYLISSFLELFCCQPREKFWKPWLQGHCMSMTAVLNVVVSSINSASDIIILVLPQLRIWALHMPLGRKVAVSAVFLVGVMACAASVVRLAYTIRLYESDNISYSRFLAGLWTIPELSIGISVACLPIMPKFFKSINLEHRLSRLGTSLQTLFSGSSSRHRSQGRSSKNSASKPDPYPAVPGEEGSESDQYPLVSMLSRGSSNHPVTTNAAV